jgi:hypothetical protein
MSRGWDVFFGVMLIVSVWSWMIVAGDWKVDGVADACFALGRVITACFVTGPIYREYLR